MPRRFRWRGIRAGGACPRRISGLLEFSLLLLLRHRHSHGYELIEGLRKFGLDRSLIDPSTVYRALRRMEMEGLVASEWDVGKSGPPRRVYHLTPQGKEILATWVADLRETANLLSRFLDIYNEHTREGRGEGAG